MNTSLGGAITGGFPSLKMQRTIQYASTIERDLLFFLEFDRTVLRYREQPFCATQTLIDGTRHRYTPDFLLGYADEQVLVECKPFDRLEHPHTQQQCQMGQQWADENDARFRLVTDTELRAGHQLANLKLLWRYSRFECAERAKRICLRIVSEAEELLLQDLCRQLEVQASASLPLVYRLLFHHHLQTDLHQRLSPDSIIRRGA